jgi:hypothetical protein
MNKSEFLEQIPQSFIDIPFPKSHEHYEKDDNWVKWKMQMDANSLLRPIDMFKVGEILVSLLSEDEEINFIGIGTSIPTHELMIYKAYSLNNKKGKFVCVEQNSFPGFELPEEYKDDNIEFHFIDGTFLIDPMVDIRRSFSKADYKKLNVLWDYRGPFNLLVGIVQFALGRQDVKESRFYTNSLGPLLSKYRSALYENNSLLVLDSYSNEYERAIGSKSSGELLKVHKEVLGFTGWDLKEYGEGMAKIMVVTPPTKLLEEK